MTAPRILSLLPSATEIVCALGAGAQLVGRSHECDFPPWVERLPACTTARVDSALPSAELDAKVRALVRQAVSIYAVRLELAAGLRPDVVVTQTQCEVCAVSEAEVRRALRAELGAGLELVALGAQDLAGVYADIETTGAALGLETAAHTLSAQLRTGMAAVAEATAASPRPRVVCLEWLDPPMCAGHWLPELVQLAGGLELLGEAGRPSRYLSWEALAAADPDVLLMLPCGFGLERTARELAPLLHRTAFSGLRAVRTGAVYLADGNHYFNRPGPRLLDSLEILAEILHPEHCDYGHAGRGWRTLHGSRKATAVS